MRQEYTNFFLAVHALTAVELLEYWQVDQRFVVETEWMIFSLLGLALYIMIRLVKKPTDWFVDQPSLPTSG